MNTLIYLDLPTANNKSCIIPFVYENNVFNYCAFLNKKLQCLVDQNENLYDTCSNGNF